MRMIEMGAILIIWKRMIKYLIAIVNFAKSYGRLVNYKPPLWVSELRNYTSVLLVPDPARSPRRSTPGSACWRTNSAKDGTSIAQTCSQWELSFVRVALLRIYSSRSEQCRTDRPGLQKKFWWLILNFRQVLINNSPWTGSQTMSTSNFLNLLSE